MTTATLAERDGINRMNESLQSGKPFEAKDTQEMAMYRRHFLRQQAEQSIDKDGTETFKLPNGQSIVMKPSAEELSAKKMKADSKAAREQAKIDRAAQKVANEAARSQRKAEAEANRVARAAARASRGGSSSSGTNRSSGGSNRSVGQSSTIPSRVKPTTSSSQNTSSRTQRRRRR